MHARAIGFFGARGSGKSHLAKGRARRHPRVVAFLPVPLDTLPHAIERRSLEDVRRALIKHYDRGFAIVWRPPIDRLPAALSALSYILIDVQRAAGMRHEVMLYADELAMAFPERALPAATQGFVEMCLTGRHYRVQLLGCGQRLALVSNIFTGNLDELFVLRPSEVADVERARQLLGREWAPKIQALRNRDYVHKDFTNGRIFHYRHNGR